MSWTGAIVLYAVSFFLCLFMILPRGVPTQLEEGDVEPGTPGGAPAEIDIRRKFMWAAAAAVAPVALFGANAAFGWLTLDDFSFLFPASFAISPALPSGG